MSGTALAPAASPASAAAAGKPATWHVFGTWSVTGGQATALATAIDPPFLAEAGWDAELLVLRPPATHPLLGRPVCRAPGCGTTAPASTIARSTVDTEVRCPSTAIRVWIFRWPHPGQSAAYLAATGSHRSTTGAGHGPLTG